MLRYALSFFIVAIIAALFGFTGIAGDLAWVAKVLVVAFLIMAVMSFLFGGRRPSAGI